MNIITNKCKCDECGKTQPNLIILSTSDGDCSLQLCIPCAKRAAFILNNELKGETV